MKLKIKEGLACRRIGGETFVVDAAAARLHELNGPASLIWEALAAGADRGTSVGLLTAEFDVDAGTAGADYDDFVGELSRAGLLSPGPGVKARRT